MTNLLFLTPDIPAACTNYQTYRDDAAVQPNEDDFQPHRNTLRGHKWQLYRSGYAAAQHNALYDLGHVSGVANTKACNFIVISRLDFMAALSEVSLIQATMDFTLQSSSDNSAFTARHTITDVSLASLVGSYSNDYVSIFADTSAFRYWRCNWLKTSGADFDLIHGKVYFGSYYDVGEDADYQIERLKPGDTAFYTSGDIEYPARIKHPTYQITLQYEGLTDAELLAFQTKVFNTALTTPIFLYTQSNHSILDNKRLLYCRLTDQPTIIQRKVNWNDVSFTMLEDVG